MSKENQDGIGNASKTNMKPRTLNRLGIRLGLIAIILAGLAVTGLNFQRLTQKFRGLRSALAAQTTQRQQAEAQLKVLGGELESKTTMLQQTRTALESAEVERQKARADAFSQARRAEDLQKQLARTGAERDDAQARLAQYRAAGLEPEQLLQVAAELKRLKADIALLEAQNQDLGRKVRSLFIEDPPWGPQLPLGLKGKVLAFDPKWRFIVLDIGESQGVLERGELLVSRQGKLVAKAKVTRVQKDRCVANLLPGWQLGEILEGDVAIADPHS